MIPTRLLTAFLLVALAHGTIAWCDDAPKPEPPPDPCVTELTLEKLDNPPQRKTKFEVVEEVWKERLVDVKVADQKFSAVIRIKLPNRRGAPFDDNMKNEIGRAASLDRGAQAKEFALLQTLRGQELLNPSGSHRPNRIWDSSELEYQRESSFVPGLKRMLAQIPADRLPAQEQQEFFTNRESDRLLMMPDPRVQSIPRGERRIVILAVTAEQAEARAKALLAIFDQGWTRPIQKELFKVRQQQCESLRESEATQAAAQKSWEMLTAKLKEFEEFTPDMLSGLRVQQLQLDVDLAGVKAKIATCERLLAKADPERRKQIEDAKIAAEIELSGFEARRAKSAEFVSRVKERNSLDVKSKNAGNAVAGQRQRREEAVQFVAQLGEDLAAFAPVRLVDDRVTIHPLEWTQ